MGISVGITLFLKNGKTIECMFDMDNTYAIPLIGDTVVVGGTIGKIEERKFVTQKNEAANPLCSYSWSLEAREI